MKASKIGFCALMAALLCASAIAQAKGAAAPQPKVVYALQEGEAFADNGMAPMIRAYGQGQAFIGIKKGDNCFAVSGAGRSGPFAKLSLCSASASGLAYFVRRPDGNSYFIVNGKEYGPYKNEEGSCSLDKAGFSFTALKDDGKWYADLNGKELGPYDKEPSASVAEGGYNLIVRKPDGSASVTVNDAEYGPYKRVDYVVQVKSGFIFTAQKADGKWYAIVNGKEAGPFEFADGADMDAIGFGYFAKKADMKYYTVIYGKEYGPFDGEVSDIRLGKGSYAFAYKKADDSMMLQINGKQYGPYGYAFLLWPTKAGYAYEISKGKYSLIVNGKEFECFSDSSMSLYADFYDSGAWYFSQLLDPENDKSLYGIRLSDGTVVKDSIANSQILDKAGKPYCVWFTRKGDDIFYNEKELK